MRSRENQGVVSTTACGDVGRWRSRVLVLVLASFVAGSALAAPRDDHRDGGSRSEQRPARESRPQGAPRAESRPGPRPQVQPVRPSYAPQQGARPDVRSTNPVYGRKDVPRQQQGPQYGSPSYGAPGYASPGYRSPNYGSPGYPAPQNVPRYRAPYPQQGGNPAYDQPGFQSNVGSKPGRQHLDVWMAGHQGLSSQEQERALQSEPGFNRLAPDQQQRLVQRLRDLNNMRPGERERTLARVENMERLSPQQRDQVRGAASRLQYMPMDRQRAVRRAFQDLRNVPPGLRNSELNSPRFAGQFSPEERSVLGNLLSVEPYRPAPPPQYP